MDERIVGKVLASGTRGFVFGTRVPKADVPIFGALVKARIQHRHATIYGVIANIEIRENSMARVLAVSDATRPEEIEWLRRQVVPVEASVCCVAYREAGETAVRAGLPSQPPVTLDDVWSCDDEEVLAVTAWPAYLRVLLDAQDIAVDEVLAAHVRLAAECRPPGVARETYVVATGRELSRHMAMQGSRLEGVLQRICA